MSGMKKQWVVALTAVLCGTGFGAEFYTPKQDLDGMKALTNVQANLPNVLILGDSISIGYTVPVRDALQGAANVFRPETNCGDTRKGLEQLDVWLGDRKWDVIHFNWGLHDLAYRSPKVLLDKVNGAQSVPLEQYKENLEKLVVRLKQTGAVLIWASTTAVPENEPGRVPGDEIKYNAAAAEIMKRHGVTINDLHALTAGFGGELSAGAGKGTGNVHYTKEGSALLSTQVAATIGRALRIRPE
jgi:hypothetical protein